MTPFFLAPFLAGAFLADLFAASFFAGAFFAAFLADLALLDFVAFFLEAISLLSKIERICRARAIQSIYSKKCPSQFPALFTAAFRPGMRTKSVSVRSAS